MDEFSSALQHLFNVHEAQIQVLEQQLEAERRVGREQQHRIEALEKANNVARKAVEQAKKKIKQQQSVIRKLEQQRVNGGQDESIMSISTAGFDDDPVLVGVARSPLEAVSATHKLNQTCAALFESPATVNRSKVSMSETPGRPHIVQTKPAQVRDELFPRAPDEHEEEEEEESEKEEPVDYHRGESVETVADQDVIILDDEVACGVNNNSAHQPLNLAVDPAFHQKSGSIDEESNTSPPSSHTCTRDPHINPLEDICEQSPDRKKVSGSSKLLSLRNGGSNKVKWREVSSALASLTNSGDSLSETRLPSTPDKLGSPNHDSESTSTSSSPDQSSPSLLGASSSPRKQQRSSSCGPSQHQSSTPVNLTQSLFAKTPVTTANITVAAVSVVKTTPVAVLKSAIPQSDSQFSLDVSQSAPLSPELCAPTIQHPLPAKRKTAGGSEVDLSSAVMGHVVDHVVLPITPGVPSVNKILQRDNNGWMMVHAVPVISSKRTTVTSDTLASVRNVSGGKRGQDQVDFEDEDVLPQSKVHRLTSMDETAANSYYVDEDHTRLEVQEGVVSSGDEEEAVSPIILHHPNLETTTAGKKIDKSVTGEAQGSTVDGSSFTEWQQTHQQKHDPERLLRRAGLPTGYKYEAVIRRRADRDKLEGKACPDCKAWFAKDDGIHGDVHDHLRYTCRHKHLHLPPTEDSRLWNISFPSTEECEEIMDRKTSNDCAK